MPIIENKEEVFALGNNVLVEMIEEEDVNSAGLAIPKMTQERETCAMGKVISTGLRKLVNSETNEVKEYPQELLLLETFNLQRGDIVLLKKYDYVKVKVLSEDKEYRIYDAKSVIGKINKNVK